MAVKSNKLFDIQNETHTVSWNKTHTLDTTYIIFEEKQNMQNCFKIILILHIAI